MRSNPAVEPALVDALRRGDGASYVTLVAALALRLPVRVEAEAVRPVPVRLPDGRVAVAVYSTPEALTRADPQRFTEHRTVTLADLAEHWPDPSWVLAVDPGLPSAGHLPGGRLAALVEAAFPPANEVEAAMVEARRAGDGTALLGAFLGAVLYLPLRPAGGTSRDPGDPQFPWWPERADGCTVASVFTSGERLRQRLGIAYGAVEFVVVHPHELVGAWPDRTWTMAVNPGTPMAATLTGDLVTALARRLREVAEDPLELVDPEGEWWTGAPEGDLRLQVLVPHQSVGNYLGGGYDRAAGKVHPCPPPGRRLPPGVLYFRLGLLSPGSPFTLDDESAHLVRWQPTGEQAREWLADPVPRNASVMLPDGAALYRVRRDGSEELVAVHAAGTGQWVRSGP
jgi:hypothetical protein